jgi:hypothetical protein
LECREYVLNDRLLEEKSRCPIPQVGEEYGYEDHYETTWPASGSEVFLTGCDGEPFVFPNDLAFGPGPSGSFTEAELGRMEFLTSTPMACRCIVETMQPERAGALTAAVCNLCESR